MAGCRYDLLGPALSRRSGSQLFPGSPSENLVQKRLLPPHLIARPITLARTATMLVMSEALLTRFSDISLLRASPAGCGCTLLGDSRRTTRSRHDDRHDDQVLEISRRSARAQQCSAVTNWGNHGY